MKKILKLIRNTDGQALVESALVISFILIPLILGMIDVCWILNRQIILNNAAREGARAAVVCNNQAEAYSAADTIAKSSLTGAKVNDLEFTDGWNNGNAKVILSAPITPIVGFVVIPNPDTGTVTLTATAVMRRES
jgi:Flp pilus assembly protein TadG